MSGETPVPDAWGIMANHAHGDKICRPGAQCWVIWRNTGNGFDRNFMCVRSRGGRWVEKWMRADRLMDWRAKWVPPVLRGRVFDLTDRNEVEHEIERMRDIFRRFG